MNSPNQLPPQDNINQILDKIISENGVTYSNSENSQMRTNIFKRYANSLLTRNPLTIAATIIPVSLLIFGSVLIAGPSKSKLDRPSDNGNSTSYADTDAESTEEEQAEAENKTNTETTTNPQGSDSSNPSAVATITNLTGGQPVANNTPRPTPAPTPVVPVPSPTPPPTPPSSGTLGETDISSLAKCTKKQTQSSMAHFSPYPLNNSTQGDQKACNEGYSRIDHDFLISKDGVVVNTHWQDLSKDGFVSGSSSKKQVNQLTWAEILNLKSPGGYHIRSAYQTFKQTCSIGLDVFFEVKSDPRFEDKATWTPLAGYAQKFCGSNWRNIIKVNSQCQAGGTAAANKRLAAARSAGFIAPTQCF